MLAMRLVFLLLMLSEFLTNRELCWDIAILSCQLFRINRYLSASNNAEFLFSAYVAAGATLCLPYEKEVQLIIYTLRLGAGLVEMAPAGGLLKRGLEAVCEGVLYPFAAVWCGFVVQEVLRQSIALVITTLGPERTSPDTYRHAQAIQRRPALRDPSGVFAYMKGVAPPTSAAELSNEKLRREYFYEMFTQSVVGSLMAPDDYTVMAVGAWRIPMDLVLTVVRSGYFYGIFDSYDG